MSDALKLSADMCGACHLTLWLHEPGHESYKEAWAKTEAVVVSTVSDHPRQSRIDLAKATYDTIGKQASSEGVTMAQMSDVEWSDHFEYHKEVIAKWEEYSRDIQALEQALEKKLQHKAALMKKMQVLEQAMATVIENQTRAN